MFRVRTAVAVATHCVVVAAAGCGVGPGESSEGTAALSVTRDYGQEPILEAQVEDPSASETVLRMIDREAEITTRYGGGFVQSINGLEGSSEGGRVQDWFFFVNGLESSLGAAEVDVQAGDRIWWDYRDWTDALRTPAVVGSWPEPFAGGQATIECFDDYELCKTARRTLEDVGAEPGTGVSPDVPRMLIGTWDRVRRFRAAAQIEEGPATSGVFARFERSGGGWALVGLDQTGAPAFEAEDGGLVAAVREGEDAPIWVVTGTDVDAVRGAVGLLSESDLRDRYAVASGDTTPVALPVQ
jgi:hypothetical protein